MKNYHILGLALILTAKLFAQTPESVDNISKPNKVAIERLSEQIKKFPQEKTYLQLDKSYYFAGDTIWYRIHMVHAAIHTPIAISRYVYVELLNAQNEVVSRRKIRPENGPVYFGQMGTSPQIAQGWYTIRSYTNFMRNVDENYFFRQKIYIGNSSKNQTGKTVDNKSASKNSEVKDAKDAKNIQPEFDVQFFPEGGALIAGNMQIIGFKAISKNGLGIDISGRILDDKNKELITFKSSNLGMGQIALSPESGKTYTAVCDNGRGQKLTFKLPDVSVKNYALVVKHSNSIISVSLLEPNTEQRKDTLYLIGNLRGVPFYQAVIPPKTPEIVISKQGLNSGVTQFLLLNKNGEILSERLIYVSGQDKAKLDMTFDKTFYINRDAAHATISLKDSQGKPVEGNFSISVTDDNNIKINANDMTIESYLLLQSDLKGNIENPNNYFRTTSNISAYNLDLLMLTQGWKRYNVAATLIGNYDLPNKYPLEIGPVISGKIQSFPGRRGIPLANVNFMAPRIMQINSTQTDNYGRFMYPAAEFPDSTSFLVSADKKLGTGVELVIDPDTFPDVKLSYIFPNDPKQDGDIKDFLKKSNEKVSYENGIKQVTLKEFVVTAKKREKNDVVRKERGAFYQFPSFSFDEQDLSTASTIMSILSMAPGVTVDNVTGSVMIRNLPVLIKLDNFTCDASDLENIQPSDVKLIDILKEPGDLIPYGPEGKNGVICVYLKYGAERTRTTTTSRNSANIMPLGYDLPAQFYIPKYNVEVNKQRQTPDFRSTIFWSPNVKTDSTGVAHVRFYTADSQGPFTITAEGVTPQGEIIRYQEKINIKK